MTTKYGGPAYNIFQKLFFKFLFGKFIYRCIFILFSTEYEYIQQMINDTCALIVCFSKTETVKTLIKLSEVNFVLPGNVASVMAENSSSIFTREFISQTEQKIIPTLSIELLKFEVEVNEVLGEFCSN